MRANAEPEAPRPEAAGDAGQWITPDVSYVNPNRRFCAFCGRPIARRYWQATGDRESEIFCEPAHAALHTTYPIRSND